MASNDRAEVLPQSSVLFDAHCHPTDTMDSINEIACMNATALTIMATRAQDQELVAEVANAHGINSESDVGPKENVSGRKYIVPSFGWHPWFSYQLYDDLSSNTEVPLSIPDTITHFRKVLTPSPEDEEFLRQLPEPRLLSEFIRETKALLEKFPTALIGEVGLDRAFRLPEAWIPGEVQSRDTTLTPGGREGRRLSPYKVEQEHQTSILLAQLKLAGEFQRAVSVHGVQAHGILFNTLAKTWRGQEREVISKTEKKRRQSVSGAHDAEGLDSHTQKIPQYAHPSYPPRVCLHSYSGPPDFLKQYFHPSVPVDFFLSFSVVINFSASASSKTEEVIRLTPDDNILVESDMHVAGKEMDQNLEEIARKVCTLKSWSFEEGLDKLANNWKRFIFGNRR